MNRENGGERNTQEKKKKIQRDKEGKKIFMFLLMFLLVMPYVQ